MGNSILEPQIIKVITRICRNKKVVNLGCGEDSYGPIFKAVSRKYLTLDVDSAVQPDILHDLNRGLPQQVIDYDPTVLFVDGVLERLKDPDKRIREWKQVASDLIITVRTSSKASRKESLSQKRIFTINWFRKREFEVQGYSCQRFPKDFWEGVASYGFVKIPKCEFLLAIYYSNSVTNSRLKRLYQKTASYVRTPLLRFWADQREYLQNLLAEKEYALIILDACRYDYFKKTYDKYLVGNLIGVKSPASVTCAWLKSCFVFEDKYGAIVYSANPFINSKGAAHPTKDNDYNAAENFVEIVDVWEKGYLKKPGMLGTPPDLLRRTVEKTIAAGDSFPRKIIWFAQPHAPWLGKTGVKELLKYVDEREVLQSGVAGKSNYPSPAYFARRVMDGTIPRREFKKAYEDNLKFALEEVAKLVPWLKGRIVVTSDHGELLGESGAYFHSGNLNFPALRIVPWLEVKESRITRKSLDTEENGLTTENVEVEKRLKQLGYL